MMNLYFTALEVVSFKATTRNMLSWVSTQPDDLRAKCNPAAAGLHLFPKCLLQKIYVIAKISFTGYYQLKKTMPLYIKKKKKKNDAAV